MNPLQLRALVHAFIRRFGLLDGSRTPCGQDLPTSKAHALMELLAHPGLRQCDLGQRLGLTKSGVSRLVAGLVASGHVTREADPQDGRAFRVRLTQKGHRLATHVDQASRARFTSLLEALPPSERRNVCASLNHLVEAAATLPGASREG
jgi:DNA-binding MarR family transcriptional regulator